MKLQHIFLPCIISGLLLAECKTPGKTKQDASAGTVAYAIPPNVSDANRAALIEKADKGKVLFKIHCAECHGIFSKGKDSIPNFTKDQIDNYRSHTITFQNHPSLRQLSADQFDAILTFLQYRKVTGHHH